MSDEDLTIKDLMKLAEEKEVQAPRELEEQYSINPAMSDDVHYSIMLHFMEKMAEKKGDEHMKEKLRFLKDMDKMVSISIISKKLNGEDLLNLISERPKEGAKDSGKLFKEAFGVD